MEPEPFSDMLAESDRWGQCRRRLLRLTPTTLTTSPQQYGHSDEYLEKRDHGVEKVHPKHREPEHEAVASSGMTATLMVQNPGPTLIGERVNSQGSRKVKQLLLADDYDNIVQIAVDQVNSGATCSMFASRSPNVPMKKAQMEALVKKLSQSVTVPLIIDTTEAEVAEAALALYPGRGVINGNNLENGRERIDRILPIVSKYGAAVLSMTIDEGRLAHTRDKKYAIAKRITEIAVHDYSASPEDLIFDTLTFPLTTGQEELRNDAVETIEGIRLIKQHIRRHDGARRQQCQLRCHTCRPWCLEQ
ncbi:MAG: dihydropteroate synthase [Anaerolineae bacterium]